jgi:hypothetical protein
VCPQIWDIQQTASGAGAGPSKMLVPARASGRAKASGGAAKASGGSGRTIVTGMEGLEPQFRAADIYPPYQPGTVQAMHSGGLQGRLAGWEAGAPSLKSLEPLTTAAFQSSHCSSSQAGCPAAQARCRCS